MIEFTKHYKGINAISDCIRDLEKMADVCTLMGNMKYPQTDLVIDLPYLIGEYYKLQHTDKTSNFFIGFRKTGSEVGGELQHVLARCGSFGKALFLVKLTLKYTDVTMEAKAEI